MNNLNKKNEIITKSDLSNLEIGTVLVSYFHLPGPKPKEQSYAIVTEDGLKYFQYKWYLTKFAYDPAENGIGINVEVYENEKFKQVD